MSQVNTNLQGPSSKVDARASDALGVEPYKDICPQTVIHVVPEKTKRRGESCRSLLKSPALAMLFLRHTVASCLGHSTAVWILDNPVKPDKKLECTDLTGKDNCQVFINWMLAFYEREPILTSLFSLLWATGLFSCKTRSQIHFILR